MARRRSWGQILSASGRAYVKRPRLFLGIGVVFVPLMLAITLLQWLVVQLADALGSVTGDLAGLVTYLALVIGTTLALLGFALVQAATACALVVVDRGESPSPVDAYRLALRRIRPLLRAVALFVLVWLVLTTTVVLIPVAIWLAVRWSLAAPVVELEDRSGRGALRRSSQLVRHRWIRVASLVGLGAAISLAAGPLLGALLIFVSESSLAFMNLVSGVVYALALPFVALVTCYVYVDARTRLELDEEQQPDELPAEIALS